MCLSGLRLIVTGATGFIGSAIVRHAATGGADVTALARRHGDTWRLEPVLERIRIVRAASDEYGALDVTSMDGADALVHCAAAGVNQRFDDVGEMVATNVGGTLAALQLASRLRVGRVVLLGTSGEYGPGVLLGEDAPLRPTSEYGATRASATLLALAYGARRGLPVTVLRPFSVFGPFEAAYRLVPHCILRALDGQPLDISAGSQTRDFVYVGDVVRAIAAALVLPPQHAIFNICTGTSLSVSDMARAVAERVGSGAAVQAGALGHIPGEMWQTSGDPARAAHVLGWTPRHGLEAALDETIAWFRTHVGLYRRTGGVDSAGRQ